MCHKFRLKFPDAPVPNMATIYNKKKRFGAAGSLLASKRRCRRRVLIEEKIYKIGAELETSPGNSMSWLMQKTTMSALLARNVQCCCIAFV
jgi:hypothetical protein